MKAKKLDDVIIRQEPKIPGREDIVFNTIKALMKRIEETPFIMFHGQRRVNAVIYHFCYLRLTQIK